MFFNETVKTLQSYEKDTTLTGNIFCSDNFPNSCFKFKVLYSNCKNVDRKKIQIKKF